MYCLRLLILPLLLVSKLALSATAEDFARLPVVAMPQLSPDGKSVAMVMVHSDEAILVTKELATKPEKYAPGAVPVSGAHIQGFGWLNNERLLVVIRLSGENRHGKFNYSRVFTIGRDGHDPVYLNVGTNKWGGSLVNPSVVHLLPDDPEHILMRLDPVDDSWTKAHVHKVNVLTGKKELVYDNRKKLDYFIADAKGNLRVAGKGGVGAGNELALYIKAAGDDPWRHLETQAHTSKDRLIPHRMHEQNENILLLTSAALDESAVSGGSDDYNNLYEFDLTTGEVLGRYRHERHHSLKKALEKSFDGRAVEIVSVTDHINIGKAIIRVYGDVHPDRFFLFDTATNQAQYFGDAYPQLSDVTLSKMQSVEYTARDGLTIPAYLTVPHAFEEAEKPKLPLVVYPHGGPWARDHWGFDNYVQFFAHKGYVVFQPQFRGSTGFGYDHLQAGFKEWGQGIQNDITDGVQWLVEQGLVDPKRICIVGSSFGGYAAAMGLATTPDLYKCGISINGVLDMKRLNRERLRGNDYERDLINSEWGISKVSPYHLADNMRAPILIIAGENDTVVNPEHSRDMYKKLHKLYKKRKPKVSVEYIELPKGEHWRTIESNEIKTFQALEAFLGQHLDSI